MHIQSHFAETRSEHLRRLIAAHPLATFVAAVDGEVVINHMPMLLTASAAGQDILCSHVPRANPIWRSLDGACAAVAVFHGPQAYITPSWYPSKHEHGKVVPTWNYAVVHALGHPQAVDDRDWLLRHLNELTDSQESRQPVPWRVADAPPDFVDRMLEKVVGIEMPVEALRGKWKLSQNRSVSDRRGVVEGLQLQGDDASMAMQALVARLAAEDDARD